jgi:hypothetical protein
MLSYLDYYSMHLAFHVTYILLISFSQFYLCRFMYEYLVDT